MKIILIWLFILLMMMEAKADVLGVTDAAVLANLVQQLNQLKAQYAVINNTYLNAKNQLSQSKAMLDNMQGHYGYGELFNTDGDVAKRKWSPDSWDDALAGLSGGNPARYRELVAQYQQTHPVLTQHEYQQGASHANTLIYQHNAQTTKAAATQASYVFNSIENHIDRINHLTQQIEKAPNTKSAIDLNSRILSEVAYIQLEELKMTSILNQQQAATMQTVIDEKTVANQFNRLDHQ